MGSFPKLCKMLCKSSLKSPFIRTILIAGLNVMFITCLYYTTWDFPGGSVAKNPPAVQEVQIQTLGGEDSLEKEMATHSSNLAWKIPWTQDLVCYSPRVTQSRTRLSAQVHTVLTDECVKHKFCIKPTWSSQWHFEVGIIIIQMGKSRLTFFTCKALPHENSGAATGRDVGWICLVWRALWSTHYLNLNPFLNFSFVQLRLLRPVPFLV